MIGLPNKSVDHMIYYNFNFHDSRILVSLGNGQYNCT